MKKAVTILIIIIIGIVVWLLWWYDDTKIIEEPIDIVKNGEKAFSVVENEDNVVWTIYDDDILRTVTTYYFENGIIDHIKLERVYKNKEWARGGMKEEFNEFYDRELNGNIVIGKINSGIGLESEGFAQKLIDTYSKSWVYIK